ncbi:phage major capsid protein [Streptomyces sp. NPDC001406]|uniref:phage major capsid protein n=1 Tax=Streptomyces sp. NPDC001406 TaxID=3364572 RepID=UPI0036AF6877
MGAHPLLVRAAQCVEAARALNDEFPEKGKMPAEVKHKMDLLLNEASECKAQFEREQRLDGLDDFLKAPVLKHDMGGASEAGGKPVAEIGGVYTSDKERQQKANRAFFEFVRKGHNMAPEVKADLVEDASGMVLIPHDFAGTIVKDIPRRAVMRNLATVRPTSRNKVDVGSVTIAAAGWGKMETGTVPSDGLGGAPGLDAIEVFDLNALIKLGRDELEDSDEDLSATISDALSLKFAEQEDDAFAAGNGTTQPQGLAVSTAITQGVAAAAGQTVTGDELKSVIFQLPSWADRNAAWLGHKSAELKIALLKDANGNYLWQPRVSETEPAMLMGYPWYRLDGLPAITTTADAGAGTDKSVFFGDVRAGYMIADRRRLTVQRLDELYAAQGKVGLLFTMRVGGGVIRPNAMAWYKL